MARGAFLRIVSVAAGVAAVALVLDAGVGCIGGNCSSDPPGIDIFFSRGVSESDVASVTVSCSACGPVPSPLCVSGRNSCDPADEKTRGWDVLVPCSKTGVCPVHVALKDGETFDDSVKVKYFSDCGSGYYGDHAVTIIPAAIADGGAID